MEKLPIGKRIALKVLLPLAHSCVSNREATKSILIRFLSDDISFSASFVLGLLISSEKLTHIWPRQWSHQDFCLSRVLSGSSLTMKSVNLYKPLGMIQSRQSNIIFIGSIFIAQRPQKQTAEKSDEAETSFPSLG